MRNNNQQINAAKIFCILVQQYIYATKTKQDKNFTLQRKDLQKIK